MEKTYEYTLTVERPSVTFGIHGNRSVTVTAAPMMAQYRDALRDSLKDKQECVQLFKDYNLALDTLGRIGKRLGHGMGEDATSSDKALYDIARILEEHIAKASQEMNPEIGPGEEE